MMKNNIFNAR